MSNSLELNFINNPNAVYFPNQVVAGTVELRLREVVNARGLRLIVKGKAECKWSESTGSGNSRRTKHYKGTERYLHSVSYMFGSENGETVEVAAGVHSYNFECLLPELLPYSVEGKKGFIRYKVEATLDIPWGFDYESEKPFTVVRYDDLNLVQSPNYRQPCEVEEIKTFCCLFCESDPLIMTVRVPKTGFGLGEKIPIHIQIVNKSTTDVYSTEFQLEKVDSFHSTSPAKTKTYTSTVTSRTGRGIRAGQTVNFEEFLEIPRVLSTSNGRFCKVVEIKYYIYFKANTDGCGFPPGMTIDITIGNVGVLDGTPTAPPVPAFQLPTVSPTAPLLPPVPKPLDDLPPSFEEATRGTSAPTSN